MSCATRRRSGEPCEFGADHDGALGTTRHAEAVGGELPAGVGDAGEGSDPHRWRRRLCRSGAGPAAQSQPSVHEHGEDRLRTAVPE
ncbi:hypothetical protein OG252_45590 [Streptomyces sp. NBC_01352]|uniref:hypothetical protein n=1 Tax=Streptomyces sp. NBC_01352 TaxID=2903834 RepID=UPI002E32E0BF|nr:hypothetical protein [Streptomyces sp. NBC_01352]